MIVNNKISGIKRNGAWNGDSQVSTIGDFIKKERKKAGLTQEMFALRAGLGLRFVRELEQGKESVRLDKVNQALAMFGMEAVPGRKEREKQSDV